MTNDSVLRRLNCLALKAAQNLLSIERVALHQHRHQASNRFLLSSDDRTRALELLVDQLVRRFLHSIEQRLAMWLIGLAEVNRSEPAHTKLTDHPARNLHRALDVVRSARRHCRQQYLLGGTSTQQQRNLIFQILALLHEPIALRQ